MAYLLGIDTGGTYTDAVILDEAADTVVASAKALTSRPDLSQGVGAASWCLSASLRPSWSGPGSKMRCGAIP